MKAPDPQSAIPNAAPAVKLGDGEVSAMARLPCGFVDAVGGSGQDPNDPGYMSRRQDALPGIGAYPGLEPGWTGDNRWQGQAVPEAGGPRLHFWQKLGAGQSLRPAQAGRPAHATLAGRRLRNAICPRPAVTSKAFAGIVIGP
jgi:hypothetical protein